MVTRVKGEDEAEGSTCPLRKPLELKGPLNSVPVRGVSTPEGTVLCRSQADLLPTQPHPTFTTSPLWEPAALLGREEASGLGGPGFRSPWGSTVHIKLRVQDASRSRVFRVGARDSSVKKPRLWRPSVAPPRSTQMRTQPSVLVLCEPDQHRSTEREAQSPGPESRLRSAEGDDSGEQTLTGTGRDGSAAAALGSWPVLPKKEPAKDAQGQLRDR